MNKKPAAAWDKDFFVNLSHELRTPLNAVLGYSQDLLEDEELPREVREKGRIIHHNGDRLLSLFSALMDYSLPERTSDQAEGFSEGFCPLDVIAAAAESYRREAAEKGVQLRFPPPEALPVRIFGSQEIYRKILLALVENAVKFTREGSVTVELAGTSGKLITQVADTGIGISQEVKPRIFEPFFQGDSTLSRTYGGLGLGLTLVERMAVSQGGTVEVESPLTPSAFGGTRVSVTLPYRVTRETLGENGWEILPEATGERKGGISPASREERGAGKETELPRIAMQERKQLAELLEKLSERVALFDPERIKEILDRYQRQNSSCEMAAVLNRLRREAESYDDVGFARDLKKLGEQVYGSERG